MDTCPPLPRRLAKRRSSRSAEVPAGVDTCPIPALGWRAGLPHALRHVRGQPCLRDTWPESFRGQGRFPAASSPVAAATAFYLFFRRMAAGVHGNNALDPSPIKRVHLHLPSTTATASLLTWLAGLCRGCGFSICVWDKRAFLCFDSLNTSFLLSHMAQCLCLAVTRLTANPPTHS